MKKFDIGNIKFSKIVGNYYYILELENDNCFIERIKQDDNRKQVDFINLIKERAYIVRILYENDKSTYISLNALEKDEIVNDIFNAFSNSNNINDFISLDDLLVSLKNSYIKCVFYGNELAFSKLNEEDEILYVVLLESNTIIGSADLNSDQINVDDIYFDSVLYLLNKYKKGKCNSVKVLKKQRDS